MDKAPEATRIPIVDDEPEARQMLAEVLFMPAYCTEEATREAGGVTIAQDEKSSVIFGMPGEADRLGAAEGVLAPRQIVGMIRLLPAPR